MKPDTTANSKHRGLSVQEYTTWSDAWKPNEEEKMNWWRTEDFQSSDTDLYDPIMGEYMALKCCPNSQNAQH